MTSYPPILAMYIRVIDYLILLIFTLLYINKHCSKMCSCNEDYLFIVLWLKSYKYFTQNVEGAHNLYLSKPNDKFVYLYTYLSCG